MRRLLSQSRQRVAGALRVAVAALPLLAAAHGEPARARDAHAAARTAPAPGAPAAFAQSAATFYALNCMGCHPPPPSQARDAGPLRGEFFHSSRGRNFFIRVPQDGRRVLSPGEDARLLDEILTWKRSCAAILQDAPQVNYSGERFVK